MFLNDLKESLLKIACHYDPSISNEVHGYYDLDTFVKEKIIDNVNIQESMRTKIADLCQMVQQTYVEKNANWKTNWYQTLQSFCLHYCNTEYDEYVAEVIHHIISLIVSCYQEKLPGFTDIFPVDDVDVITVNGDTADEHLESILSIVSYFAYFGTEYRRIHLNKLKNEHVAYVLNKILCVIRLPELEITDNNYTEESWLALTSAVRLLSNVGVLRLNSTALFQQVQRLEWLEEAVVDNVWLRKIEFVGDVKKFEVVDLIKFLHERNHLFYGSGCEIDIKKNQDILIQISQLLASVSYYQTKHQLDIKLLSDYKKNAAELKSDDKTVAEIINRLQVKISYLLGEHVNNEFRAIHLQSVAAIDYVKFNMVTHLRHGGVVKSFNQNLLHYSNQLSVTYNKYKNTLEKNKSELSLIFCGYALILCRYSSNEKKLTGHLIPGFHHLIQVYKDNPAKYIHQSLHYDVFQSLYYFVFQFLLTQRSRVEYGHAYVGKVCGEHMITDVLTLMKNLCVNSPDLEVKVYGALTLHALVHEERWDIIKKGNTLSREALKEWRDMMILEIESKDIDGLILFSRLIYSSHQFEVANGTKIVKSLLDARARIIEESRTKREVFKLRNNNTEVLRASRNSQKKFLFGQWHAVYFDIYKDILTPEFIKHITHIMSISLDWKDKEFHEFFDPMLCYIVSFDFNFIVFTLLRFAIGALTEICFHEFEHYEKHENQIEILPKLKFILEKWILLIDFHQQVKSIKVKDDERNKSKNKQNINTFISLGVYKNENEYLRKMPPILQKRLRECNKKLLMHDASVNAYIAALPKAKPKKAKKTTRNSHSGQAKAADKKPVDVANNSPSNIKSVDDYLYNGEPALALEMAESQLKLVSEFDYEGLIQAHLSITNCLYALPDSKQVQLRIQSHTEQAKLAIESGKISSDLLIDKERFEVFEFALASDEVTDHVVSLNDVKEQIKNNAFSTAIDNLEKLLSRKRNRPTLLLLAKVYSLTNQYANSEAILHELLTRDENDLVARIQLIHNCLYFRKFDEAEHELEHYEHEFKRTKLVNDARLHYFIATADRVAACNLLENFYYPSSKVAYRYKIASTLYMLGDYEDALECAQSILADKITDEYHLKTLNLIININIRLGKNDEALAEIDLLKTDNAYLAELKLCELRLQQRAYAKLLVHIDKAMALNPNDEKLYYYKVTALKHLQDTDGFNATLKHALAIFPQSVRLLRFSRNLFVVQEKQFPSPIEIKRPTLNTMATSTSSIKSSLSAKNIDNFLKAFKLPISLQSFFSIADEYNIDWYIYGGSVYDLLLGRTPNDLDIKLIGDKTACLNLLKITCYDLVKRQSLADAWTCRYDDYYFDVSFVDKPIQFSEWIKSVDHSANGFVYSRKGIFDPGDNKIEVFCQRKTTLNVNNFKNNEIILLRCLRQAIDRQLDITNIKFIHSNIDASGRIAPYRMLLEMAKIPRTTRPVELIKQWCELGIFKHILPDLHQLYAYETRLIFHEHFIQALLQPQDPDSISISPYPGVLYLAELLCLLNYALVHYFNHNQPPTMLVHAYPFFETALTAQQQFYLEDYINNNLHKPAQEIKLTHQLNQSFFKPEATQPNEEVCNSKRRKDSFVLA